MKNILFITESYHYKASPNGICVQRVAENLVKSGHYVCVVTLFNDLNQKTFENINGVDVYRVDAGFIERKLYENSDNSEKSKKIYNKILKLSRINGLWHAFKYPLLSKKQVRNLYKQSEKLYRDKKFEYVICAYHKIADVLAGIKLKRKNPNIKLILYTLDAISGGWVPNILKSAKIPMNSLKRWERFFFKHIDKMFAMESHRYYYETNHEYDKYKNLIEYLDIPLLNPLINLKTQDDYKISMVYTGSMSQGTANPSYLLKIINQLENAYIYIYGRINEEILNDIQKHELYEKRIFIMGSVSHEEIIEIQHSADVLLNFGNANPNMIPCKIFEYMSTGNKIISFTSSSKDSSLPYIKKYTNGLIISEEENLNEQNISDIKNFILKKADNLDENDLKKLFEKNTPEYFERKLLEE